MRILFSMVITACVCSLGCGDKEAEEPKRQSPKLTAITEETPHEEPSSVRFEDVTAKTGIDLTYRNGEERDLYAILETLGGGVAILDFNCDGLMDIFAVGGGHYGQRSVLGSGCRLFANEGDWIFRDATERIDPSINNLYSHGVFAADYNNDGWTDVLVTGFGRLCLLQNRNGNLEDVTSRCGLDVEKKDQHWSTAAAWGDLNGDGRLDLFVTHYVDWSLENNPVCPGRGWDVPRDICSPNRFGPLFPQLFMAQPDGTFREIAESLDLQPGKGLGCQILDVNSDGLPDIYVANDALHNHLYINGGDGSFEECGILFGVAFGELGEAQGSMGVETVHLPGDRDVSLLVTNFHLEQHAFYRHKAEEYFEHASQKLGIASLSRNYVGWGIASFDMDHDGDEDLVITNGDVFRYSVNAARQNTVLLECIRTKESLYFGNRSFGAGEYFNQPHRGRGIAIGDLDHDGWEDLVISHINEPLTVLRNLGTRNATETSWLGLELIGNEIKDPIGARVILNTESSSQLRVVKSAAGYLSTNDRRIVFGTTGQRIRSLRIEWPSGLVQKIPGGQLKTNAYQVIREPSGM